MRWLRHHPAGPLTGVLSFAVLMLASTVLAAPTVRADAVSRIDTAAALLYIALPLVALTACASLTYFERPWTVEALGPVLTLRARVMRLLPLPLVAGLAPPLHTLMVVIVAGNPDADLTSLVVYTLVPMVWLWVVTLIATGVALALRGRAAPIVAAVVTTVLIFVGRGSMYPLGASAFLAGTRPVTDTWLPAVLALVGVSLIVALGLLAGPMDRRVLPASTVVVGVGCALALSPVVPERLIERSGSGETWCSSGSVQVCGPATQRPWMERTAASAADVVAEAQSRDLALPVRRIEVLAADTSPAGSVPPGTAATHIDRRAAPEGMSPDQVAPLLVGVMCVDDHDAFGGTSEAVAKVATWLSTSVTGDTEMLTDTWPDFAGLSPAEKTSFARDVLSEVECEGA